MGGSFIIICSSTAGTLHLELGLVVDVAVVDTRHLEQRLVVDVVVADAL
jgi:hypothetical protein